MRASDIPMDVMADANAAVASALRDDRCGISVRFGMIGDTRDAVTEAIARAILAERERCAKVAENFFRGDKREWNDTPMGQVFRAEDNTVRLVALEIRKGAA